MLQLCKEMMPKIQETAGEEKSKT